MVRARGFTKKVRNARDNVWPRLRFLLLKLQHFSNFQIESDSIDLMLNLGSIPVIFYANNRSIVFIVHLLFFCF